MHSALPEPFCGAALRPDRIRERTHLAITLLISILIHFCTLWLYDNFSPGSGERKSRPIHSPIEIQLARASLERRKERRAEPKAEARKPSLPVAPNIPNASRSSKKAAETRTSTQASAAAVNSKAPAKQASADAKTESAVGLSGLITTLGSDWSSTEPDIACNPRERASKIRRCEKERSLEAMDKEPPKFEGSLGEAFARLNPSNTFRRDMLKVESLLEQQKQLTSMLAIHGDSDKDLQQQHLAVTDELKRIDKKYSSVNLFKVLGTGAKFTTALINQQRQKKK